MLCAIAITQRVNKRKDEHKMCVANDLDMCALKEWAKCIEFHGHACPGLAYGFRAATIALKELGVKRAKNEELMAIVENDASGVDAVQVVTGCSIGKGNLVFRNLGKHVYTFGNRRTGEAVRIATRHDAIRPDLKQKAIMEKARKSGITQDEKGVFWSLNLGLSYAILEIPDEEFCNIRRVELDFPSKAPIFESIICANCGESVAESKARIKDGKAVCMDCAGQANLKELQFLSIHT
jgi:formylmethanofuran dehydrogenase subunit E